MRSNHTIAEVREAAPDGKLLRLAVRLATLAYWLPCAGLDIVLLWRGGFSGAACGHVFALLFRESLLFLGIWFAFAALEGLVFGASREPRMKRGKRADRLAEPNMTGLGRQSRGL